MLENAIINRHVHKGFGNGKPSCKFKEIRPPWYME